MFNCKNDSKGSEFLFCFWHVLSKSKVLEACRAEWWVELEKGGNLLGW